MADSDVPNLRGSGFVGSRRSVQFPPSLRTHILAAQRRLIIAKKATISKKTKSVKPIKPIKPTNKATKAVKAVKTVKETVDAARNFAIEAARLAGDTHCKDITVLDVRGISPITDYFVIATGTSARQMRSVAQEVEEMGQPQKFRALSRNGYEGENWILTDFVTVILHIFAPDARTYYDLDGLWGDAPRVEWEKRK